MARSDLRSPGTAEPRRRRVSFVAGVARDAPDLIGSSKEEVETLPQTEMRFFKHSSKLVVGEGFQVWRRPRLVLHFVARGTRAYPIIVVPGAAARAVL